jgi:hypothetical protein
MNVHILSNLEAQQTCNENNAIDQMKKKKPKLSGIDFKSKHNTSNRFNLYW